MARLQTRDELIELIRVQYDSVAYSTATNPSLAAVQSFLNESLQAMYALKMECYGDDYFTQSLSILTQPGVDQTSLPYDFAKLKQLTWRKDAETGISIPLADARDLGKSTLAPEVWGRPKYRLSGSSIQWLPVPIAEYIVDIWYVGIPQDLAAGTDTVDVGPGWVQFVVADVCMKIAYRLRDDSAKSWYAELRRDAEQRVRAQAPGRAETDAPQVRDALYGRRRAGHHDLRDALTTGDE